MNIRLKKSKTRKGFRFSNLKEPFINERNHKKVGFILLLISTYLLIACISFIENWKKDIDKLSGNWTELILNTDIVVNNSLGKIGALISHWLIFQGFGIASFIVIFLLIIIGLKGIKIKTLPIISTIKHGLTIMIWVSLFFGHFFTNNLLFGGSVGYECNIWLNSMLGTIGTRLFLVFSIIVIWFPSIKLRFKFLKTFIEEIKFKKEITTNKDINIKEEIDDNIIKNTPKIKVVGETNLKKSKHPIEVSETEKPTNNINIEVTGTEKEETLTKKEIKKKLEELGDYDPTLELSNFKMPGIDLLKDYGDSEIKIDKEELENNKESIVETLGNYNIGIASIKATIGPTITLYEIVPEAGIRISKIKNLEDDIALSLAAEGIRIIAPIPGKGTIGIEVPNKKKNIVSMHDVISSEKFQNNKMALPIAFGKTISNETYVVDLAKMPHLLMAGATGQGKSVGLNAILTSLLYKKHPSQVKFVLVDPKKVELTLFNKIERHYLAKLPGEEDAIITDTKKVVNTINSLCIEMDERYELCKNAHCRNIAEYNKKFISRKLNPNDGHRYLPYIVLVIDEFADLIMTAGKEIETPISRLAQLARAIGIHLIVATQRPSVNVITGLIKANFPARVAFRVTSSTDSRTIMDSKGAEQLIGMGDMLISTGSELNRLQCAFIDTPEVDNICDYIGSQRAYPSAHILPEFIGEKENSSGDVDLEQRDVLFEDAARVVIKNQSGSTSMIQRRLKLGYNRAGRIIDELEAAGIVGPFEGSKARQVLVKDDLALTEILNKLNNES
tara:strand:- start:7527 stop:9887 length:2361 start_codon:yes stop_codon:yes gene_type:complete